MPVYQWIGKNRLNKVQKKGDGGPEQEAVREPRPPEDHSHPDQANPGCIREHQISATSGQEKDIILFARQSPP
jgi:hypothetical protein